jgi:hypothetical protein
MEHFGAKTFVSVVVGALIGGLLLGWVLVIAGESYIRGDQSDLIAKAGGLSDLQHRQTGPDRK